MPKRKISLQEAFARIDEEGLEVEVKGMKPQLEPPIPLDSIIEPESKKERYTQPPKKFMRIDLHAQHTIGSGGVLTNAGTNEQRVEQEMILTFGPGKNIEVPIEHAAYLKHQDALAQQADARAFDGKFRSFIVGAVRVGQKVVNVGFYQGDDPAYDMSAALGQIGNNQLNFSSPLLHKITGS